MKKNIRIIFILILLFLVRPLQAKALNLRSLVGGWQTPNHSAAYKQCIQAATEARSRRGEQVKAQLAQDLRQAQADYEKALVLANHKKILKTVANKDLQAIVAQLQKKRDRAERGANDQFKASVQACKKS